MNSPWNLQVSDLKNVTIFHYNVIHVHGLEAGEILWQRDEVNGGLLVELKEIRVVIVPLPPEARQLSLQLYVGGDHLIGGSVDQDLPSKAARLPPVDRLGRQVLDQANHPILKHPDTRHVCFPVIIFIRWGRNCREGVEDEGK